MAEYYGYKTKRQRYEVLRSQLENERSSFISHWRDCADFVFPRRPRFMVQDVNRGERRSQKIIDSTPTLAARTLRSGMMGGITSPARRWFRLTTPDPDLAEVGAVKRWLYLIDQRMETIFLRSNLYNVLPTLYGDMGVFGTAAIQIEEDFHDVVRFYSHPIGSYMISNNEKLRVDTFMRDFQMTVRQLVERFGYDESGKIDWSKFSDRIKQYWDEGQKEIWIEICHVIEPNPEFDPKKIHSKYKRYSSCYFERGCTSGNDQNYITSEDEDRYLSEKGYDLFPVLCPRWEVTGEDVYGTNCPAMEALGDIKQLMVGEKRTMQAVEKGINPPMVAPTSLRNSKTSILPGDITYSDEREGQKGFRAAHDIQFNISQMEEKQSQVRRRISRSFYEDLFLMLAQSDRREITAREIDERHEEKLLALGPVLEQLNQDLLDPLIDITFDIMNRQGWIPTPPEELQGLPLKVEYISIMAQAQKAMGIGTVERFAGFVGGIAKVDPQILDKINTDELIDTYGEFTSIPPSIIRTDDEVEEIRAARAQTMKAQQMAQAFPDAAGAAKDLSQASLEGKNALTQLLQQSQAGALV